jgi:hypothetical protein
MSPAETNILEKYSWESSVPNSINLTPVSKMVTSPDSTVASASQSASQMLSTPPPYLPYELFLLLQVPPYFFYFVNSPKKFEIVLKNFMIELISLL